jgi:2-C-methyl-D-erythritol 4-phosphate cytidylyltransferase
MAGRGRAMIAPPPLRTASMWCVIPAAGSGRRFGGDTPKQYCAIRGQPLLAWTLARLAGHPAIDGFMVAIAADDGWWPGWTTVAGKPIRTTVGGAERAHSVLAGVKAISMLPDAGDWVLVHDAARPCLPHADLDALLARGLADPVGAILAARVRETVKQGSAENRIEATLPRERLWRAQTPQLARREHLQYALEESIRRSLVPTDEASALETIGEFPLLVEGSDENLKVTSSSDLALAADILARQGQQNHVFQTFPEAR